ncbi:hypothetical protein [Photobacterium sp. DNB22_13_2]
MNKITCLLGAILLSGVSQPLLACSYDGQFNNPFSESYPGALDIAIATQKAIEGGELQRPEKLSGKPGLRRASWWLSLLDKQMTSSTYPETHIYLVDSQLWARYSPSKPIIIHSEPASSQDSTLMLSETALNALISQSITLEQAKVLGIANQGEG